MKKVLYRLLIVIATIFTGILLVASVTYFGDESTGPVDDFFGKVTTGIRSIENKYILKKREKSRSLALDWFTEYRADKNKLVNTELLLLGAYDNLAVQNFEPIVAIEDSLNTVFPLVKIYTAWGSKREQRFPADEVNAISSLGSVPVITWEPWLNDFDKQALPGIPDSEFRDSDGLLAIARGVYDSYVDRWAQEAKDSGVLMFLRFAHEMNDPYRYPWGPQNNKPEEFIQAWRHVVSRFKDIGADNVIWVWSPHLAYGEFEAYYPGDEFVDWVGTGTLNYGTVAPWSQWWTFDEIFAKSYETFSEYGKPIMISEYGTLAVGGDRAKWYKESLSGFPEKFPLVKGLLFFHNSTDATTTYQVLNWSFKNDPEVSAAIRNVIGTW
ncbi:glycoside hydrolase family 26 protein [Aquiflexum lacus]|uniref:glycoside hydrolase family 26 protein n=1 Tax=Aquiflexum lacus TaxID=2483805 RepID=UPI00189459E3|nr:glycosyl hydrolase [Aquiflexum lacus]